MPTDITPHAAVIWLAVGFIVGIGWSFGAWLVGKVVQRFG
jgi:hypothetical protein